MKLGKMEIVSILAGFHGYTSYLEICTPTTAGIFSLLDTARFTKIHRLVYDASDQFDDGAPVELRSPTRDIEPCLAELSRRGERECAAGHPIRQAAGALVLLVIVNSVACPSSANRGH